MSDFILNTSEREGKKSLIFLPVKIYGQGLAFSLGNVKNQSPLPLGKKIRPRVLYLSFPLGSVKKIANFFPFQLKTYGQGLFIFLPSRKCQNNLSFLPVKI